MLFSVYIDIYIYMKAFTLRYNKALCERNLYGSSSTVRKYTTEDISNWVKYGRKLGLYKLDGSKESEENIFQWIDYLLKSNNINI